MWGSTQTTTYFPQERDFDDGEQIYLRLLAWYHATDKQLSETLRGLQQSCTKSTQCTSCPTYDQEYPFQCICSDFFHYKGAYYLIIVAGSQTGQLSQESMEQLAFLENYPSSFQHYGIPKEISSDGGQEFTVAATQKFLKTWGVRYHLLSVTFPHSNCRAELHRHQDIESHDHEQ